MLQHVQHSSAARIYSMCTLILILALYNKDTFTYLFQGNLFKQSSLRLSDHGGDKSFGLKAKIDSTENMNKAKIYIKKKIKMCLMLLFQQVHQIQQYLTGKRKRY